MTRKEELAQKITILTRLSQLLSPDGRIVIADLAFSDRSTLEVAQQAAESDWEEEFYWIADETLPELGRTGLAADFVPVSSCAGVFVIPKP